MLRERRPAISSCNCFSALLVKALRPQVLVCFRVNQLNINPYMGQMYQNAAFQHVANAQFSADLPDRHRTALICEGSGPRDDEAAGQPARQISDQSID